MNSRSSIDGLAGAYELRPGHTPAVAGRRPVLGAGRLAALLRGLRGDAVGQALTSIFTLCAHAHRRTSALAMAAARADTGAQEGQASILVETARDHLRSIALDWPQRIPAGDAAPDLAWLRGCPLRLAGAPIDDAGRARNMLAELRDWLVRDVLLAPPADWLAHHRDPAALAAWCEEHAARLPPARCLAEWHPLTVDLTPPALCLDVLGGDEQGRQAHVRTLARHIAGDPGFVQQPTWRDAPAENGPWARQRHLRAVATLTASVWSRLTSRWLELLEIAAQGPAATDDGQLLAAGALTLAPGEGIAWCEMARGLLFHWVRVDAEGAVLDYRVLAPTEWNFHPGGTLACEVARLDPGDTATAARPGGRLRSLCGLRHRRGALSWRKSGAVPTARMDSSRLLRARRRPSMRGVQTGGGMSFRVLWLQSGGCGGCSMSMLCADTQDFAAMLRGGGIEILWHPALSLANGGELIDLLEDCAAGRVAFDALVHRRRAVARARTAPGASTCWPAPACP